MKHSFDDLLEFLEKLPAINLPAGKKSIGHGQNENGLWWVKFSIDTNHKLSWRHIQELGNVLNYLSVTERLPTIFMPVSPPSYLNGGVECISWVIESKIPDFTPSDCVKWLLGRMPNPVDNLESWNIEFKENDEDEDV
jgi:hypothetical protein